jgi:uncharacterized protein YcaQ
MLHAANALGVATEQDLRDYFRLSPQHSKAALAELLADGACRPVRFRAGSNPPIWRARRASLGHPHQRLAVAVRFAGLGAQPHRALVRLPLPAGDLHPAHKRVYGYYVLPFLHRERIAARLDLRAERGHGRLAVHAVHEEERGLDEEGYQALAIELRRLAGWLGLEQVQLNCPRRGQPAASGSAQRRTCLRVSAIRKASSSD